MAEGKLSISPESFYAGSQKRCFLLHESTAAERQKSGISAVTKVPQRAASVFRLYIRR